VPGRPSSPTGDGEPAQDGTYGAYLPYSAASPSTPDTAGHAALTGMKPAPTGRGLVIPAAAALVLALAGLHLRHISRSGNRAGSTTPSEKSPL
jgi:hypothetical protein